MNCRTLPIDFGFVASKPYLYMHLVLANTCSIYTFSNQPPFRTTKHIVCKNNDEQWINWSTQMEKKRKGTEEGSETDRKQRRSQGSDRAAAISCCVNKTIDCHQLTSLVIPGRTELRTMPVIQQSQTVCTVFWGTMHLNHALSTLLLPE